MKAWKKLLLVLSFAVLSSSAFAACGLETSLSVKYMVDGKEYVVQKYDLNDTIALPKDPTQDGKRFVGWYTDPECTQPYAEGSVTQGLTLYAKFEASVVFIIVNTNGGEKINMISVKPGEPYSVPDAVKPGHTFTGYYYVDANGETQEFPSEGVLPEAKDIIIFASYTVNKYTVTLHNGYGSEEAVEVEYNKTYAPKSIVRPGYTFVAWHTVESGQSEETIYDATKPVTANVDLYAQYTANDYKITLVDSDSLQTIKEVSVTFDAQYTISAPEKVGYTISAYTFNGATFATTGAYTYASDIRVSVKYEKSAYTVTFVDTDGNVLNTQSVVHGEKAVTPALTKYGYTYTLSANATEAVTANTEITVTYTAKTVNIAVNNGYGYTIPAMKFGDKFTLTTPERLGYIFQEFEGSDGKTYQAGVEYTCDFESLTLTAQWDGDDKSVTFIADGVQYGNVVETLKGHTISRPHQDPAKDGYTFKGWSTVDGEYVAYDFSASVEKDFTLYAYFTPNPYYIRIELDGGVGETQVNVTYGASYSLTAPTKKGYTFGGFVTDNNSAFAQSGTYSVVGNSYVKATWTEDKETVVFYNENDKYFETTVLNGFTVSAPTTQPSKLGYTFQGWSTKQGTYEAYDFDSEVVDTLALYAYFAPNTYTVTIYDMNGNAENTSVTYGAIPSINMNLTNDQLIFNGYYTKYDGQYAEQINFNVPYLYTDDLVVYQWWEDPDEGIITDDLRQEGNYFVEKVNGEWTTYVYLVGHTYNFKATVLSANTEQDFATIIVTDGNTQLVAEKAGEFTVTVTKPDGTSYVRTIKVVEKVFTFTTGEDYKGAWTNRNAKNWNNNEKGDLMQVGRTNFIPDVKLQKLVDGKLTPLDFASANVEYTVTVGGAVVTDYTIEGNSFNFGDTILSGSTVSLTMSTRYAIYKGQTVTFNFELNDALNVYTSEEMRTYFEDSSISAINVLRNIKVELADDKLYHGSNPADYDHSNDSLYKGYGKNIPPADLVSPINTSEGNAAYDRLSGNLVVNGNYFTVDGSNIPLVDNRLGHFKIGDYSGDLIVQNVQFSIFKFGKDGTPINDKLTMSNLYVLGNMTLSTNWGANDGETYTVTVNNSAKKVLTMSGAVLGLQARCANMKLDNVTIRRCAVGISTTSYDPRKDNNPVTDTGHPVSLDLKDCLLENHWANNVYMYGFTHATFDSCYVGVASGAAIHVDAIASPDPVNPEVHFTNGTKVENWVAGSETWFTVYQMNLLVPELKAGTEIEVTKNSGGIYDENNPSNNRPGYLTVLKNDGSQLFNFAFLMKGTPDAEDWINGNDDVGKATVTVTGFNELQELFTEKVTEYVNDNIDRVYSGSISLDALKAEGQLAVAHTVCSLAQSVRVAPGEMPDYADKISMFGEVVAYLGVYPRG